MADAEGGDRLAAYMKGLDARLSSAQGVKVGFLEGATYPNGTSVALIAAINEYGAPSRGQPARPFFRNVIREHKGEWPRAIAALMRQHNNDAATVFALVGEGIAGQLRQSINDLMEPPLAQSTIARKGFDKPLIDTSNMINSVDSEIIEGGA